jgi:translocator protein
VRRWGALFAWIVAPLVIGGGIGGLFGPGPWYEQLNKPPWNPPNWVFGPAWTLLYVLMGTAAWLIWDRYGFRGPARVPLALFAAHLLLVNAGWSIVFFGLQSPGGAMVVVVGLWTAVLALAVLFWRLRPVAGALLLPYLAWVSFAAALNFAIWQLN